MSGLSIVLVLVAGALLLYKVLKCRKCNGPIKPMDVTKVDMTDVKFSDNITVQLPKEEKPKPKKRVRKKKE